MKINKKFNTTTFRDVRPGAVFQDTEGTVYMKLDTCYKFASVTLYNAVVLENGSLVYFADETEKVEVLDDAILNY